MAKVKIKDVHLNNGKGKKIKLSPKEIFTVDDIIKIHDFMIDWGNELENLNDPKTLDSPVVLVDLINKIKYKKASLYHNAALIVYHNAYQHPFTQGNKRTSLLATQIYLVKQGYIIPSEKMEEFRDIILRVAKYEIGVEEIKKWMKKNVVTFEPVL